MQVKKQQLELDTEQTGSKLGKEYIKAVYCHPIYLTYVQSTYIMGNTGLDDAQARIKTARRNINNLRYADDTILMAASEEELKSILMRVKEESETPGFKLSIQKTKITAFGPISQFSHSVVSNFLGPHGLQHTRLPCPSPTPVACSNSCPSSQ